MIFSFEKLQVKIGTIWMYQKLYTAIFRFLYTDYHLIKLKIICIKNDLWY